MSKRHGQPRPGKLRWCFDSPGERSLRVLRGDTAETGGAEAQVAYLAKAFADLGHLVTLIYGDGRASRPPVTVGGIVCLDVAAAWRWPASIARLWRALQRLAPDIVYARLPYDFLCLLGLSAWSRPGARFVYSFASDTHCRMGQVYDYNRWFHEPLYALGLKSADRIAFQHVGQLRLASPRCRDRMFHVPNLLCTTGSSGRSYARATIDAIWVGRIRPEKRLERFLDLAASLPDCRFAVVGGFDVTLLGRERCSLEQRLHSLPNVDYCGARQSTEVIALMAASKVLLNTSDFEGFPNTMLEAWGVGVPVVSLLIDPGGIIEREQLGRVSGNADCLRSDVQALAGSEALNRVCGDRGLAYVRRQHSFAAVYNAFVKGLGLNEEPLAVPR